MAYDYAKLQTSFGALIAKFGRQYRVTRIIDGADSNVGTTYGVYDTQVKKLMGASGGPVTLTSKVIYLAAPMRLEPAVGDTLLSGRDLFRVTNVEKYAPAATIIAWKVTIE